MKNYSCAFALVVLTMFWSCDRGPSGHPCDDPHISNQYLSHDYDSLFPYDKNWETLKYLYSNDTIENDTMVFELERVEYWDVDTSSAEGCLITNIEVRRFFYKSTSAVFKKLVINMDNGTVMSWEDRNRGQNFSFQRDKLSEFNVVIDVFINPSSPFGEIRDEYEVNSITYTNAYYGFDLLCKEPHSKLIYSTKFGFLEVRDSCDNEVFTLLK